MKLEIVKEHVIEYGKSTTYYSIRRKLFGFLPVYKIAFIFDTMPTFNRVFCAFSLIASGVFTLIQSFIALAEGSLYPTLLYLLLGNIFLLYYYNYSFKKYYENISDAENEIKQIIKYKTGNKFLNKEVVQTYDLKNNQLTIQKQNESK